MCPYGGAIPAWAGALPDRKGCGGMDEVVWGVALHALSLSDRRFALVQWI